VKQYLDEWVYGVKDRDEYWQKLGAQERLKVTPQMSEPINYGKY
jgi:glutaconate CoA-transferase subunit A